LLFAPSRGAPILQRASNLTANGRIMTARALLVVMTLVVSSLGLVAREAAHVNSFYHALQAQGITSDRGDQALFAAEQQVCKDTPNFVRYGGDFGFTSPRGKAADNLALDDLQRPRSDAVSFTYSLHSALTCGGSAY
jgi:hypothetical protein